MLPLYLKSFNIYNGQKALHGLLPIVFLRSCPIFFLTHSVPAPEHSIQTSTPLSLTISITLFILVFLLSTYYFQTQQTHHLLYYFSTPLLESNLTGRDFCLFFRYCSPRSCNWPSCILVDKYLLNEWDKYLLLNELERGYLIYYV